jgi:hypothetical protein
MRPALRRPLELVCFAAVPIAALVLALWAYAGDDRLALDFHHEVYRQAQAVVDGRDAYAAPDADLSDRSNLVWPMAAVLPVVPLTAVSPAVADWVATAAMLASLVAVLWLLKVRDWRIYGVVLLWPAVIESIQTANASLPLTLLVAVMWRYRDRAGLAGLALGYAVAGVAALSLFLLMPFTSIPDYVRLLRNIGEAFEHQSYTPFALLTDLGVPDGPARALTIAFGLGVLVLACRRRSLGLAIAAALVLSPIVWRHFFSLLIVPLALSRPRFDAVWLIPIGMWVGDGTFNGAPWQTACVLGLAVATVVLCERPSDARDVVVHSGKSASVPI